MGTPWQRTILMLLRCKAVQHNCCTSNDGVDAVVLLPHFHLSVSWHGAPLNFAIAANFIFYTLFLLPRQAHDSICNSDNGFLFR